MNRLKIPILLAVVLALTPFTDAASSSSEGGYSGGGLHGRIQSVTTTNFSVGFGGGKHHRRGGNKAVVVHYNPDTVTITVDGETVRQLDYHVTGKYVTVVGTMKNAVLEATSITVSSTPPAHAKKSKSSN